MNKLAHIKPHGNKWIVTKQFYFDTEEGDILKIHKGFIFDGCSIPICIFGQRVEPSTLTACCIHDYLFNKKIYSFYKSNYYFVVAMRQRGVSKLKMIRYWLGVSLFGYIYRIKK